MPLINCKVELKIKRAKDCVLTASGADNANPNSENIIFIIKDPILYVPVVTISKRIKNYQNFVVKDLKDQFIRMNIKQKVRLKIEQMNIDIFSNQILLELTDYLY